MILVGERLPSGVEALIGARPPRMTPHEVTGGSKSSNGGTSHVNDGPLPMIVPAVVDTATVIILPIGGASRCGVCGG
jgi:hypothetical protein